MIPLLAVMLAAYIVARMADQMAERTEHEAARGVSIILAIVAAGVAVICAIQIVQQGSDVAAQLGPLLP